MDGVLIESEDSNIKFFQDLIESFGYPRPSARRIKSFLHLTSKDMIKTLLPNEPAERIEEIWRRGFKIYSKYLRYIKLKPGVKSALEKLSKKFTLGIATSRVRSSVESILKKFNLKKYFEVIITFEDYENPKPHPEPLLKALKKLKLNPNEAIYVGDTISDFEAAKRAGMKVIIYSKKKLPVPLTVNSLEEIISIVDPLGSE